MGTFTGHARRRSTARSVFYKDRLARWTITLGGIGTILAVCLVCFFLLWVVLPLLLPGKAGADQSAALPADGNVVHCFEDEYRNAACVVTRDGRAVAFATADGTPFRTAAAFDAAAVSAVTPHVTSQGEALLLGRRDGALQLVKIALSASRAEPAGLGDAARRLAVGASLVDGETLVTRPLEHQFRRQVLEITAKEPLPLGGEAAVVCCDVSDAPRGRVFAALTADGLLHLKVETKRLDLMSGEEVTALAGADTPLAHVLPNGALAGRSAVPDHFLLNGSGDNVLLVWRDGLLLRIDARDIDAPVFAERRTLLPAGTRADSVVWQNGKMTLLVAGPGGAIDAWFGTKPADASTPDGIVFARARSFAFGDHGAVLAIGTSQRSRLFVAAHADGSVQVLQGTSERLVAEVRLPQGAVPAFASIARKEDGIAVLAGGRLHRYALDPGHPEVAVTASFSPVWYEGEAGPTHTWQSTSGTDDFEPKLGLWVLVFGTLKATFYCLLFGVPIALLAAIYTSEFLHPRWRARIKPSIELMASLPSVVLGFLAALVIGPLVANHLVQILCAVYTVPLSFLLGAQIWQILPTRHRALADRWRPLAACLALPVGVWSGLAIGPAVEWAMFGGDFKGWLAAPGRAEGSAFGGWFLVLLPLGGLIAFFGVGVAMRRLTGRAASLWRFLAGTAASIAVAAELAWMCSSFFDLRGNLFGIFDPRNSLVVGFVMGFAVVPIIYTIAEDALSAVPEHLRAASLGAGATVWQTAVRIVLPTAMSGVFSAIMVGLGRAVGETMIVVMATGSTPVLDWNVFNGFRTLSACIAIEIPEAAPNSTHYRMLYLAALCLFAMTFVLNTVAEVVRQRFRRRAYQL